MPTGDEVFTVGHSTHPIDAFIGLLQDARVGVIADVRRYAGSRRNPQFGSRALERSLDGATIGYAALGDSLGGRRGAADRAPEAAPDNSGWRNASFRAYADYMSTAGFAAGIETLERLARERRTAVMCAEAHPSRCHRRLIADALLARDWNVVHLLPDGRREPHALSPPAVLRGDELSYPLQPARVPAASRRPRSAA